MSNESKFYEFCGKMKELYELGKSKSEIESVVMDARLPLSMHLCVMGNFSEILRHGRPLSKREKLAGLM